MKCLIEVIIFFNLSLLVLLTLMSSYQKCLLLSQLSRRQEEFEGSCDQYFWSQRRSMMELLEWILAAAASTYFLGTIFNIFPENITRIASRLVAIISIAIYILGNFKI